MWLQVSAMDTELEVSESCRHCDAGYEFRHTVCTHVRPSYDGRGCLGSGE